MAQRLVRTLCPHCKQKVAFNRAEDHAGWDALVAPWKSNRPEKVYRPVGCLDCRMGVLGDAGGVQRVVATKMSGIRALTPNSSYRQPISPPSAK